MNAPIPVTIAVDFDGTCVTHEYPNIGRFIGAPPVLQALSRAGCRIILFTMRSGKLLNDAVTWFEIHDIPLFGINKNPAQSAWTDSPKVYAQIYIDDAALGAPLYNGLTGERPYLNWDKAKQQLETKLGIKLLC